MNTILKRAMAALAFATGAASLSASGFESVDNSTFADSIKSPGVCLIDVRTPKEYAEGHIGNAINIDVNAPDFRQKISRLDRTKTLAVYCRSGKRSKKAAQIAEGCGFRVIELNNGYINWKK